MCGIAGYIDFNAPPSDDVLRAMAQTIHRRGPDAQGTLIDGPCGLAHRRLSIIDLAGSPQPMQVPASDVSLTFNGEIYNYQDLQKELRAANVPLKWSGDTEVLLRFVEREWEKALPRCDGMFAFGAWQRRQQKLLLARDPLGKKPLFYCTPEPGLIVFGSEIKALLEHPAVTAKLDLDALRQVVRFRAVYGDRSLYEGIRQIEPGSWLEFSRDGVRTGCFYHLGREVERAAESIRGLGDVQLQTRFGEMIESAVRKRLIADVPVGAFLSGGLDSSVIVALIRSLRARDAEVRTFSVGFAGDQHSELPYARQVADAIGTTHTEVALHEKDYADLFAQMTACRDAPLSEPADPAIARMSEVAKQSVKVVLSGEGSDEAFCGYPKYTLAKAPSLLRAGVRTIGPERAAALAGALGLDRRRALVAARALGLPSEIDRLSQWFSYLDRAALQSLLPGMGWSADTWSRTTQPHTAALAMSDWQGNLRRMQAVDCLTWLPGNLLERGDRMTMAVGLEMRVPFLDKALVPFGIALPDHLKIRGRKGKWIVRQWAQEKLPPAILARRKWGFRVPLAHWFRGHLRPMLFDYLRNPRGLCGTYADRQQVESLLTSHDSGQTDANLALWTLLGAEVWYQDVFLPRLGVHSNGTPEIHRAATPAIV
ncbi:MAG TPA: asparagine synthase (glutamine-hydrolyzing) [Phycisphaerales bacterium]|nr:asparagine synthase (glutamine-hydrolyzing) [Phycisphaerales bacterium]